MAPEYDELLILAQTLGEVKTKTDKLEAEFATQAKPFEAATSALYSAISGIKALQFHVLDNNLGKLSTRVEEMRQAINEQVGVIALELKKADAENATKAGQDADSLRAAIADVQANLGTLANQFVAQLQRVEFEAKEEAKKLQLIPGPAGAAGASLNPRGTFIDGETYNRLDVVSWLGSSYIAAVDGVKEKPSKNSNQWQVLASRGSGGAGGVGDFGSLAGVAQINQGGTGQTTRAAGLNALLPSQTGAVQYMLLTDGAGNVSWGAQPVAGLPSQTGNSGELLTTDGVNASWSNAITVSGSNATVAGTLTLNNNVAQYWLDSGATQRRTALVSGGNATYFGPVDAGWASTGYFSAGTSMILRTNGASGTFNEAVSISTGGNMTVVGGLNIGNQLKVTNASIPDLWLQNTSGANSAYRNILLRQNANGTFKLLSTSDVGVLTLDNILVGNNATGNLLIGTATDNSLGKLQVSGSITASEVAGTGLFGFFGGSSLVYGTLASNSVVIRTNNTAALTLDTSQNATFAKDILLGTSGPSVSSTLSGRAPRQGLVSDGTGLITATSSNIGTGNFTASAWVNAASYVASVFGFNGAGGITNCVLDFPSDTLMRVYDGAGPTAYTVTVPTRPVNKWFHATWVRSGGVVTCYLDGVSQGTVTANFDIGAVNYIGSISAFNKLTGSLSGCYVYNRALSAAEVKALYENGAPAAADYWSGGVNVNVGDPTTGIALTNATVTSSTSTSINGINFGATNGQVQIGSGVVAKVGQKIRVSFSVTGVTDPVLMYVRWVSNGVESWTTFVTGGVTGSSGNFSAELPTVYAGSSVIQIRNFGAAAQNGITITNWSARTIGLSLAPDAAQTGGGLTWYDTSGNAANITLPASGVSWNVPWSGSLTPNGAATPVLIKKTQAYLEVNSDDLRRGRFGTDGSNSVSIGSLTNHPVDVFVNGSGAARFAATSGNLLLGTTTDSSNGRLQLATHTASTGGIGFGTDVSLYRSAADTLRTDDLFQAERVSGDNSAAAILGVLNTSGAGVTNSFGIDARVIVNNSSGTTGSAIGLRSLARVSNASNVGAAIALVAQVDNPGAGTITTAYGLYVNPITVGANNYSIFTEGVAPARFGGNVNCFGSLSTGAGTSAAVGVYIQNAALTGLDQFGLASEPTWTSSAQFGHAGWFRTKTAAASYTLTAGRAIYVEQPTLGAGSSITTTVGVQVRNQGKTGVTNAYGVYIESQSGASTENYALYTAGGRINFQGLPTSAAGLPAGTLWNDAGTLKVA